MTLVERQHGYVVLTHSSELTGSELGTALTGARLAGIALVGRWAGGGRGRTEQLGAGETQEMLQDHLVVWQRHAPQLAGHPPVERAPGNGDPCELEGIGLPSQVTGCTLKVASEHAPVVPSALLD
ncbi:hypothetical protein [Streptomyces albus]|uniref:hypothetical protein n=1 Tax=unclassified Streptomyces TaxID=2593676 RepID=UPI00131CF6DA|nr:MULTISPECIES: hypothetical protein [unclassified Streptomyces]